MSQPESMTCAPRAAASSAQSRPVVPRTIAMSGPSGTTAASDRPHGTARASEAKSTITTLWAGMGQAALGNRPAGIASLRWPDRTMSLIAAMSGARKRSWE